MEPLAIVSFLLSAGSIAVAAVVAVVVGRRRGIDQVEDRADSEIKRLVDAQAARLSLLEAENAELKTRVAGLTAELAQVRSELDIEKRVTARQRERERMAEADGK
jgi:hypothetical protein